MPTPEFILKGLIAIANDWRALAIFWHIYFAIFALGLVSGVRPDRRLAGLLLTLPLVSVSLLAWISANPFNGLLFALSSLTMLIITIRLPREDVQIFSAWTVTVGTAMTMFGWLYPHFLETQSFLPYVFAAPTGLIPCPTLSIVIGLSLVLNSLGSRAWAIALGVMGVFYGFFGAIYLGVSLDWILLLGAIGLLLVRGATDGRSNYFKTHSL